MLTTRQIVDGAFLKVCPAAQAVEWLKEQRRGVDRRSISMSFGRDHEEMILAMRHDAYIDFGLAKYGTSGDAGRIVYGRGDIDIRCTYLANFPNGGFAPLWDGRFELHTHGPDRIEELCALMTNQLLDDDMFRSCFERKKIFSGLNDDDYRQLIFVTADNERLRTQYDEHILDGYADYSYNSVFTAAWELSLRVPVHAWWARVLYHLLYRCQPPIGFDATKAIPRWYFETDAKGDSRDAGFYLRSRLADLLATDEKLLKSRDGALRMSFYRRFDPASYTRWPEFRIDTQFFLEGAIYNEHLWRTAEKRSQLSQLCWSHPDPNSTLDMPNMYRGVERKMIEQYPQWFADD